MSITSTHFACKVISTVILTPTRRLCNFSSRNSLLGSTTPAILRFSKHELRHYADAPKTVKWKFPRPENTDTEGENVGSSKWKLTGLQGIAGKYKVFEDFDSPIILDVDEERALRRTNPEQLDEEVSKMDPYAEMNLEHGETGVFDIEELVDVLRRENAFDVVVISVPPEQQYVDYLIIVSGKSNKHVWALAEFVRGLYKRKRYEHESIPPLEGEKNCSWVAMDLGNIALHVFTRETRKMYDLELLWSVGPKYDDLVHKKEENYIQLLEQYTHPAMSGLTPADTEPVVTKPSVVDSCELNP